ncbi:hypothetical protein LCGC14_1263030 [marine sediment metagenome]|uniref:Uncharacterized protein n=1 Tax=marine sediment metagenome TaxID=412755 RepID=A0A0F9LLH1_9ZZZZ
MSEATPKTVSRSKAVNDVVNAIGIGRDAIQTREKLIAQVEEIVVSSSGEANLLATGRTLDKTLKCAEELGLLRIHRQIAIERVK